MSMSGEEKTTKEIITIAVKDDGVVRVASEGIYLAEDPSLEDGDQHQLTLTSDAKLRVDDPTTQAAVQAVEDKLDDAGFGLEALKDLIEAAEAVSFAVWSPTTIEKLDDYAAPFAPTLLDVEAGWTFEDNIMDNNTGTYAYTAAINKSLEFEWPTAFILLGFRYSGHPAENEDGAFELQYNDGSDWHVIETYPTNLSVWTDWDLIEQFVAGKKLRIMSTILDTNVNRVYIGEVEFYGLMAVTL